MGWVHDACWWCQSWWVNMSNLANPGSTVYTWEWSRFQKCSMPVVGQIRRGNTSSGHCTSQCQIQQLQLQCTENRDRRYEKLWAIGVRLCLTLKNLLLGLMCYHAEVGGYAAVSPNAISYSFPEKLKPKILIISKLLAQYELTLKISSQSIHNVLSYPAYKPINK